MGKFSVYTFDNPYLENGDDENHYSSAVIMDEARERWRVSNWRAKSEAFDIERSELNDREEPSAEAPSPSRFKLDIKKDLMGNAISLKKLSELSYSPSYRPQGNLDEHLVTPMTTMQRYDVLAGDLESPPEDISFLTDADKRLRRELEKSGGKRDGTLRRDSTRLEKPLDERRAALIRSLPDADTAQARQIIRESQRRKERMDAEIGRSPKDEEKKKREKEKQRKKRNIYAVSNRSDDELPDVRQLSVVRSRRMPTQYGMDGDRPELPEFESETRHWSRITSDSPSWSEVQEHTEHSSPSDLEDIPETREARYIDDVEYDPEHPFRALQGIAPRERLYSEEVGQFENEYNALNGISSERVKEIMETEYRGRWIPPEFYSDNRLVDAWFNDLGRGAVEGEDFIQWAHRKRTEAEYARRAAADYRRRQDAAMRARQHAMRAHSHSRESEELRRYELARIEGYRHGVEMARSSGAPRGRDRRPAPAPSRRPAPGYRGMYPDLFDRESEPRPMPRDPRRRYPPEDY